LRTLSILIVTILLSSCTTTHKAKLTAYKKPYSEYRHIVDKRKVSTANIADKTVRNSLILVDLLLTGPYGAGSHTIDDVEMVPIDENKFTIPPILSLDMQLQNFYDRNKELEHSPIDLYMLSIRSEHIFLGMTPIVSNADCNIVIQYKGSNFHSTDSSKFHDDNFSSKVGRMVNDCIRDAVRQIENFEQESQPVSSL